MRCRYMNDTQVNSRQLEILNFLLLNPLTSRVVVENAIKGEKYHELQ